MAFADFMMDMKGSKNNFMHDDKKICLFEGVQVLRVFSIQFVKSLNNLSRLTKQKRVKITFDYISLFNAF